MPALDEVLHGSTIAINTVLEKKGARTALITTRGFRDTYAIGRGNRIEAFNLFFHRPKPLIPRELTFEVTERVNAKGEVLVRARRGRGRRASRRCSRAHKIEAVAVCLLHAYANPAHERRIGEILRAAASDRCSSRCRTRSCANIANTSAPRPPPSTPSSGRACRAICAGSKASCAAKPSTARSTSCARTAA